MMRRSAFKRPARPERAPLVLVPVKLASNVRMAGRLDQAAPVVLSKQELVRDEAYRCLVATLPCCHCGAGHHIQAAHENDGKGKAMKVCDTRTFPLCTVGAKDCHGAFDQYKLVPGGWQAHVDLGRAFTARTHRALRALAEHDRSARRIVERTIGL